MSTQAITERSPSVIATPPPLELLDVSKVYGDAQLAVQALRGVTLTVHEGEFVAVMGPSGSGKSTLLQLAGGVESPSAGCVSICGRARSRARPEGQKPLHEHRRIRIPLVLRFRQAREQLREAT